MRRIYRGVRLLPFVFIAISVHAQQNETLPPEYSRAYTQAINNTVARIRTVVAPALELSEREVFDKTKIVVEESSWDIYGIRADTRGETPTIYIPLGLAVVQDYIDSAFVASRVANLDPERVNAYMLEVIDTVRENVSLHSEGKRSLPLPPFPQYYGLSSADWERIVRTSEYEPMKDSLKIGSFGLVILHELGHLLESGDQSEAREWEADTFAVKRALAADLNPLTSLTFFLFYTAIEGNQSIYQSSPIYPAPICRFWEIAARGVNAAKRDPEFVKYIEKSDQRDAWEQSERTLRTLLKDENVSCNGPSGDIAEQTGHTETEADNTYTVYAEPWSPTPGTCNGVRMRLVIDGDVIDRIDNTRDPSPVLIGDLERGEHQFELRSVRTYCIEPNAPYHMHRNTSVDSCEGSFDVRGDASLKLKIWMGGNGRIDRCALR